MYYWPPPLQPEAKDGLKNWTSEKWIRGDCSSWIAKAQKKYIQSDRFDVRPSPSPRIPLRGLAVKFIQIGHYGNLSVENGLREAKLEVNVRVRKHSKNSEMWVIWERMDGKQWMHIYMGHFAVQEKLTEHYKSTIMEK